MRARQHADLSNLRSEQSDDDQITGLVAGIPAADTQALGQFVWRCSISQVLPDRFQSRYPAPRTQTGLFYRW